MSKSDLLQLRAELEARIAAVSELVGKQMVVITDLHETVAGMKRDIHELFQRIPAVAPASGAVAADRLARTSARQPR